MNNDTSTQGPNDSEQDSENDDEICDKDLNDYSEWSTEDLRYQSQIDEDALAELCERTGDEWYPDGRDDD